MAYTIVIPRLLDREVLDALVQIANEIPIDNCLFMAQGIDGSVHVSVPVNETEGHAQLRQVTDLMSSAFITLGLYGRNNQELVRVTRPDSSPFDQLHFNWQSASQAPLKPDQFISLVAAAKEKLRAIQLNAEIPVTGLQSFDDVTKARFGVIDELRSLASQLTIKAHDHATALERKHTERVAALEAAAASTRSGMEKELAAERAKLQERAKALDEREQEIDRSDAKSARRKLREELQRTLQEHSKRFELSSNTRRLRIPVMALLLAILMGTGFMSYLSFVDLNKAVSDANNDWWRIALVSIKQVFFAATFLGFAAYTLKWHEGWSKRHADAEFRFKQLQLDIDRASWVVEVAQEWHKDQGTEVPAELLAQLSHHLFAEHSDGEEAPENLTTAVLGAATRLKFASPAGELELDRGGIRRLRRGVGKAGS